MPSDVERCWEVGSVHLVFEGKTYISYIGHIVEVGCFHATLIVASLGPLVVPSAAMVLTQKSGNPKDWVP